jgi:hypothetical protein
VDLSSHWGPDGALRRLYERVSVDVASGAGAVGWTKRSLGRICRLVAISELVDLFEPANQQTSKGGGARVAHVRGEIKINNLTEVLYTRGLSTARANEPTSDPIAKTARRTLTWLCQSKALLVGGVFTFHELRRGLAIKEELCWLVCESLLSSGHIEMLAETKHRNKTATVTYRVKSLNPDGSVDAPKPSPLRVVPKPPAPEPDEREP